MKPWLAVLLLLPAVALAGSAFDGTWKARADSIKVSGKPDEFVLADGEYSIYTVFGDHSQSLDEAIAMAATYGYGVPANRRADEITAGGILLIEAQRFDEAESAFRRAIELNPALPEAHSNLASLLADRGRAKEAMASARRALARALGARSSGRAPSTSRARRAGPPRSRA